MGTRSRIFSSNKVEGDNGVYSFILKDPLVMGVENDSFHDPLASLFALLSDVELS